MWWCLPINSFKAVAFPMPNMHDTDIWWCACVSVLFGGYDRYPSTWAFDADIHGHLFLEIKVNQQDKYIGVVAYYLDVPVITCLWRNSNQEMYDASIGFFVVCFQIFSLETELVPYLYRCFFCNPQFSLIVLNVANQIMTYKNKCTVLWIMLRATFWVGNVVWWLSWWFQLA